MGKGIEVKVINQSPAYSSETVVNASGDKFKIVSENGNCYSRLNIYAYTRNGDIALVACKDDIPNYRRVDYIDNEARRQEGNRKNLLAAEEYIKKVW